MTYDLDSLKPYGTKCKPCRTNIGEVFRKSSNGQNLNDNSSTITTGDDRTIQQALSLINDCYKYVMDPTKNGVVITDAIKFVQTNKEKLKSKKEDDKESKESA